MLLTGAEDREYELIPAGEYNAVCSGYVDMGMQSYQGGPPNEQAAILFEIDYRVKEGPHAGKRFVLAMTMFPRFTPNSKLKKLVESWFDTVIKKPAEYKMDSDAFIGRCASVYVTVDTNSQGKKRNKILAVSKPKVKIESEQFGYVPQWILDKKAQAVQTGGQTIEDEYYDEPNKAFSDAANADIGEAGGLDYSKLQDADIPPSEDIPY